MVTVALAVGTFSSSVLIGGIAAAVSSHKVKHVVVSTRTTRYGTILVSGKTLYIIKTASKFPCTGKCLKIWPALLLPKGVSTATAGTGVNASTLGTVHKGGSLQVTYAGKPLYWFYKDTAPGQVHGNLTDKWGMWSVLVMKPAGASPLTGSTLPQGTTTSSTPRSSSTPSTMNPNTSNTNAPPPAPVTTPPTAPPVTTPPTAPPTTTPPTTTPTTSPPTTTTTSPGGGGVGF